MGFHPRVRMKKNLHWLEMEISAKGRNLKPNHNPAMGATRNTS